MRALALLFVAACGDPAPSCPGAAPSQLLYEGYCTANEADRCYFHPKALDGF